MNRETRKQRHDAIIREETDRAYHVALRATGSATQAEDAVQDAYLQMLQHPPRFQNKIATRVYFLKVVRGLALNTIKATRNRSLREENFVKIHSRSHTPNNSELCDETISLLRKLMSQLPLPECEAVSLRYEQKLSLKETAEILNVPVQTIAYRARRGLERLRERMTAQGFAANSAISIGIMLETMGVPPLPPGVKAEIIKLASRIEPGLRPQNYDSSRLKKQAPNSLGLGLKITLGCLLTIIFTAMAFNNHTPIVDVNQNIPPTSNADLKRIYITEPAGLAFQYEDDFNDPSLCDFWSVSTASNFVATAKGTNQSQLVLAAGRLPDAYNQDKTEDSIPVLETIIYSKFFKMPSLFDQIAVLSFDQVSGKPTGSGVIEYGFALLDMNGNTAFNYTVKARSLSNGRFLVDNCDIKQLESSPSTSSTYTTKFLPPNSNNGELKPPTFKPKPRHQQENNNVIWKRAVSFHPSSQYRFRLHVKCKPGSWIRWPIEKFKASLKPSAANSKDSVRLKMKPTI